MEKMEKAKMHYEQLMQELAVLGMGLSEFEEMMEEKKEEGESYEKEEGEESEEGMGPGPKMDRGRIAVIVAKMKKKGE